MAHVRVRENGTDHFEIQTIYDQTSPTDASTGTQFTPVFTNRYSAEAEGPSGEESLLSP